MTKALLVHTIALLVWVIPTKSLAFEYEVDMPNSGDRRFEMIRIKIDECETKFLIPKEGFENFSKNKQALKDLVKKALERHATGCHAQSDTK